MKIFDKKCPHDAFYYEIKPLIKKLNIDDSENSYESFVKEVELYSKNN